MKKVIFAVINVDIDTIKIGSFDVMKTSVGIGLFTGSNSCLAEHKVISFSLSHLSLAGSCLAMLCTAFRRVTRCEEYAKGRIEHTQVQIQHTCTCIYKED